MVAAVSAALNPEASSQVAHQNPKRPPLLASEAENGVFGARRQKSREVTSRYLSSTPSSSTTTTTFSSNSSSWRRHTSPLVSRTVPGTPMRSQSAEPRRPANPRLSTPGNSGEMSAAAKLLVASTRSLSVSFQAESFSLPISRAKPAPSASNLNSVRKGTPERKKMTPLRDQAENSKPIDQHRWPGKSRELNSLTRRVDFTSEQKKLGGSGSVVRELQKSMIDEISKASVNGRLNVQSTNSGARSAITSDPGVSSENNGGIQECGNFAQVCGGTRGVIVPARFWQETTNRLVSKNNVLNTVAPLKLNGMKKSFIDSPISSPQGVSNSTGLSSLRGMVRAASPTKLVGSSAPSPLRGMASSSRVRNVVASMLNSDTPSILSFAAEVRRGKVGDNLVVDAHLLRMLYNRHLQWRFINARADAAMLIQKVTSEKSLYNAWVTTLKLRHSVKSKRVEFQLLQRSLKLHSILKGQMLYLYDWDLIDRDVSSSLSGAIEALEASTLRLPVVGGAKADIQNVKDAICSAVDVMQAMASSICSLLTKVNEVNSLVSELATVTSKERTLLDHCKDLLSTLAAMQVKDCSLRAHILQLRVEPWSLTTEV
ncbi:QWRF motif-containing protein 2-like [Actinidia eriantha]|uniref:QWRF motif-containing protein 2-like n=1 Tax=Actinidia eriantha TaxID=165200 RepID=UPI00258A124D|nr:QWRF motif-containing protein 2-like [Actinidia eriantha]